MGTQVLRIHSTMVQRRHSNPNTRSERKLIAQNWRKHWSNVQKVLKSNWYLIRQFDFHAKHRGWLKANLDKAYSRSDALEGLREDVRKLEKTIVDLLQLKDIQYDCGWNVEHYRGCLKSFERLANNHLNDMTHLKGECVGVRCPANYALHYNMCLVR